MKGASGEKHAFCRALPAFTSDNFLGASQFGSHFFVEAIPASAADIATNEPIIANECGILD